MTNFISKIMNIGPIQRQSIIAFFWQIAFTALGFLSTMYFAHTVGASILGAYYLFLAYVGIFSLITDGGLGSAAVKRISEGEERNEYFSAYFFLNLIITLLGMLFLLLFRSYFADIDNSGMLIWIILSISITIFSGPISTSVAGQGKIGIRTTCAGIGNILRIIIQIIAIYFGYKAAGLAGGLVIGTLLATLIEYHFFDMKFVHFTKKHIKSLATFSFWIFLTSTGALIYSQADTLMIGYYLNNSDVGVYRIAFQFTTISTFITYALRNTLWPRISRWSKTNEIEYIETSLSQSINYSLILAIPILVGGIIVGDILLKLFYGSEFVKGYYALVILSIVQIINVFQYFFTMYLDALDHPNESFKVTIVGVLANIVLNAILIPFIGINGAAMATLVTMGLNAVLAKFALSKIIKINFDTRSLLNILKSAFIMGLFTFLCRIVIPSDHTIIILFTVVISGFIYFLLLLKLDENIAQALKLILDKVNLIYLWPKWL